MQVFPREFVRSHCVGALWPEFLGRVEMGESFLIETESCDPNGPIEIAGVKAGDDIAIHRASQFHCGDGRRPAQLRSVRPEGVHQPGEEPGDVRHRRCGGAAQRGVPVIRGPDRGKSPQASRIRSALGESNNCRLETKDDGTIHPHAR